jgi:AraC-like DNA-binding protein
MDFSQQMTSKNNKSFEINVSPVPSGFRDLVVKSGMHICCYYENVSSGIRAEAKSGYSKDDMRKFPYFVLTHLIGGDGVYASENLGKWVDMKAGWGVIASPFDYNRYGGKAKNFIEDSISFDGRLAHVLFEVGIIKNGLIYIGKERRLLPIINKLREGTVSALLESNTMLQALLFQLNREQASQQAPPSGHKIERLLQRIQDNPAKWWTVAEMAEYCNISENYLRTLFRKHTGLAPKEYIDNLKMNRAVEMLNNPQMKIYEIAERLGYVDNYHFIRRFTKILGQSPGKYRKTMLRY